MHVTNERHVELYVFGSNDVEHHHRGVTGTEIVECDGKAGGAIPFDDRRDAGRVADRFGLDELERRDLTTGAVTLCVGGGMATAMIIERV